MAALPATLPASMRLDVITNPQVQRLLEESIALRERRGNLREELRKVLNARGKCLAEHLPKVSSFKSELTASINALLIKKDELFTEINRLKLLQDDLFNTRQALQLLKNECSMLTKEIRDAELVSQEEMRELDRLREEHAARRSRIRFATMELVDKELELIDRELAKSAGGGVLLRDKRATVERAKQELLKLSAFDQRIAAQSRRVENCRAKFKEKLAARCSNEESRDTLCEKLHIMHQEIPVDAKMQIKTLRNELAKVQHELSEALSLRTETRPVSSEMDTLQQIQETHKAELRRIEDRLTALCAELPCRTFTYQPKMKSVLLGKGGATLEQLQIDFGVAICIDGVGAGNGIVVGDEADVASAIVAISEILEAEKESSHEKVLQYDDALRKRLVGTGGANLQRIERESGARVRVSDGKITLHGTPECVAVAEGLVLHFLENQHREELQFDPEDLPHVIGKNGSVIKRLEKETGVRSLIVERETHKIVATGEKACVEEVIRRYKELLEDVARATLVIHCDDSVLHHLLQPKGHRLSNIAAATGVLLRVKNGTIILRGTKVGVEAARTMLHDLRRVELRVPFDPLLIRIVTTAIVKVSDGKEEGKQLSKQYVPSKDEAVEEGEEEEGEGKLMEVEEGEEQQDANKGDFSHMLTPLELIQRVSQCEYITPIRSEGLLLLRGKQEHVHQAHVMLKDFALRYRPNVITVPFPEVIYSSLTRPRGDAPSVVNQLTASGSPLLRVQLKRDEEVAIISSPLIEEVEVAAKSLREFVDSKSSSVRRIRDLPPQRFRMLTGASCKKLEDRTKSRILMRRAVGEVQVFRDDGDDVALNEAVTAVLALSK